MSSSKFSNVEVSKDNVSRPKRAKRKLYTNEISSPIDISGQVVSYYFSSLKVKLFMFFLILKYSYNLDYIVVWISYSVRQVS